MSYGSDLEDTRECEAMRKMFVGGLNRETSEETFFEYFGQFGNMVDKVIITDAHTKQSRGFGFITYDKSDCVEEVFFSRPHEIDGKTLDVKRAMPRDYNSTTAHLKVTKLFVGGVAPDLKPEDLQEYIESRHPTTIGTVDKIDFLKDKETNKNKGFGFLECSSTDFADRLAISEQSFTLDSRSMSLKKAEPKGEVSSQGGQMRTRRPGRGSGGPMHNRGGQRYGGSRGGRGGGNRGGNQGSWNNNSGWYSDNNYNQNYNQQQQGGYNDYTNNQQNNYSGYNNQQDQDSYGNQGYQSGNQSYQGGNQGYQSGNQGYQGGNQGYQGGNRYQPY